MQNGIRNFIVQKHFRICLHLCKRYKHTVVLDEMFNETNKFHVQTKLQTSHPLLRPDSQKYKAKRPAAVLVPMCYVNGEPSLLFMMRSQHLNNHRGEVCFPGGMQDPSDKDTVHTALRETHEEIGMSQDQVDVWGNLSGSPTSRTGNWVTPVLGFCGEIDISQLKLNHREVEEVFTRSISSLCHPPSIRSTQWRYPGSQGYTLPVYLGGKPGHRIWGLTAVIVHQVLTIIAPGLYTFKLRHHR
ncbi:mitochondrial coenzyme A diphosphatase NUDT8-like [Mya arenaria]|uniref:mitochondrial coenzyme A diphosphatase NUDT8-like n=1 Tax=Mya arenaria TaxID=6604 RepID=UPI0022E70F92|nr:mitochondrial coenzyme A diphosphatase NUDT8-like [Mya arenaria]